MNFSARLAPVIQSLENDFTNDQMGLLENIIHEIVATPHPAAAASLPKMLQSLKTYLKNKKDQVHPETFKMLKQICECFDAACGNKSDQSRGIEHMVKEQIRLFKEFQSRISAGSTITEAQIDQLKAVILTIDWEISESTLAHFKNTVSGIAEHFPPKSLNHTYLKLILQIGVMLVGARTAAAPSDAVRFLQEVFEHFQTASTQGGMTGTEKKALLEMDIQRYHEFKSSFESAPDTPVQGEDDALPPALSHVRSGPVDSEEDISLTTLNDTNHAAGRRFRESDGDIDIQPALSGKGRKPEKDVMGDLFSIKESPADELLDAIHLMDVQGKDGERKAMEMLDQTDGGASKNLKNYTPQKSKDAPIPEIGSRLDAFFNLEEPENSGGIQSGASMDADQTSESSNEASSGEISFEEISFDEVSKDAIIPFDIEEETPAISDSEENGAVQMDQIQTLIQSGTFLKEDQDRRSILEVIRELEAVYNNDAVKIRLLAILSLTLEQIESPDTGPIEENTGEETAPQKSGFWSKIKSIFSS